MLAATANDVSYSSESYTNCNCYERSSIEVGPRGTWHATWNAVSWDAAACDFMFTLGDLAATGLQATVLHVACNRVA